MCDGTVIESLSNSSKLTIISEFFCLVVRRVAVLYADAGMLMWAELMYGRPDDKR